jgi:hypothetical protein
MIEFDARAPSITVLQPEPHDHLPSISHASSQDDAKPSPPSIPNIRPP